jgi:hypothetical protein
MSKTVAQEEALIKDLPPLDADQWQRMLIDGMKNLLKKDWTVTDRFYCRWLLDQWKRQHPDQDL